MVELISFIFPAVLFAAMVTDLRRFEIPNQLSLVLALSYPLAALAAGQTAAQLAVHAAVAAGALLVGMVLYFARVFGGGDAKLIAAAALWTGPTLTIEFLLLTAVFGGITALALLLFWRLPLPALVANVAGLQRLHQARNQVPYALAIAAGGFAVYARLPILSP